jgi:serine/threonine protein kinase
MSKKTILTPEGDEYYLDSTSDRLLGQGATAKVWLGADADGRQVAIKIANRGSTTEELALFEHELEIVNLLQKTEAVNCVPRMSKGTNQDDPQENILVMELIPDEWILSRQFDGYDQQNQEQLALEAGLQYVRLLADSPTRAD